jgi:hypothetical protein
VADKSMELKDLVMSTLAEIEDVVAEASVKKEFVTPFIIEQTESKEIIMKEHPPVTVETAKPAKVESIVDKNGEFEKFLVTLRERILVLFEGLQTIDHGDKNEILQIEKKMELTINFLEYLLASTDEKIENPSR